MDEQSDHGIPAANIGDTDLGEVARSNPVAANEIARLRDLMYHGEETAEEFLRLCQLLFDVGSVPAAEILLRRNLDYYHGYELYLQLFGTEKQEEYDFALAAFVAQFDLELSLISRSSFLVSRFRTSGGPARWDAFQLLSKPCEITFGYFEQEKVEADVTLIDPTREVFDADECMLMYFIDGVWEIAE